eukprot:TRINITY_DN122_c0_g1_i2.p1 TRINITY_DN122_c0_g1~~TRINITY_DN122_c0_g1_i2.p1  ORF type:complete len:282 (-),score=39.37 TRINITY_DN122_c0_g1_i2:208-1053(-)
MARLSRVSVLCLLFLFLALAAGRITCGDGKGKKCKNWFNKMYCDSKGGSCCTDDFNGWCCPAGHSCAGNYKDPGGNQHCMTADHVSKSCVCRETGFTIVKMEPVGQMKIETAYDDHLESCCESTHTDRCGWNAAVTMSNTETMTWSNTATIGTTLSFEAGIPGDMVKAGFEAKDSFTNGQTTTTGSSQTYSTGCTCSGERCFAPWTRLLFKLQYVKSTQPVKLTVRNCGKDTIQDGTAVAQKFQASSFCDPGTHGYPDANSCLAGAQLASETPPAGMQHEL